MFKFISLYVSSVIQHITQAYRHARTLTILDRSSDKYIIRQTDRLLIGYRQIVRYSQIEIQIVRQIQIDRHIQINIYKYTLTDRFRHTDRYRLTGIYTDIHQQQIQKTRQRKIDRQMQTDAIYRGYILDIRGFKANRQAIWGACFGSSIKCTTVMPRGRSQVPLITNPSYHNTPSPSPPFPPARALSTSFTNARVLFPSRNDIIKNVII